MSARAPKGWGEQVKSSISNLPGLQLQSQRVLSLAQPWGMFLAQVPALYVCQIYVLVPGKRALVGHCDTAALLLTGHPQSLHSLAWSAGDKT